MARVALQEYLSEARERINAQAFDEAITICRHILLRYPKHIRTYQILGEACLEKGETTEAIAVFKRLLEHADPENFSAYAGLGVAYEDLGQLQQAIWYMERAFELAPNNEDARNALKRLYQKRDGIEPDRLRHNKVALARLYSRGGQYQQAIQELRQVLDSEPAPGRLDLRVSLAEMLWRDGRREQAADVARGILQTAPDCLKAILLLGKILIEKGRGDEGVAVLVRTRALDPENLVAQSLFGADSPLPLEPVLVPRIRSEIPAEVAPAPAELCQESSVASPQEAVAPELARVSTEDLSGGGESETVEPSVVTIAEKATAPELPATVEAEAVATQLTQEQPTEDAEVTPALPSEQSTTVEELAAVASARQPTETAEVTANVPAQQPSESIESEQAINAVPTAESERPITVAGVLVPAADMDGLLLAPPPGESRTAQVEPAAEQVEPIPESVASPAVEPETATPDTAATTVAETPQAVPPAEPVPLAETSAPAELAVTELAGAAVTKPTSVRRRRKKAAEAPPPLEAMAGVSPGLLSEIERCRQQLEIKPKDDEARLALARAYRDAAQIKLALQEYDTLAHSKTKRMAEIVADMEGLVASRPDSLEAHELLADVYAKNGQLQQALQRYRWVLERMRQPS